MTDITDLLTKGFSAGVLVSAIVAAVVYIVKLIIENGLKPYLDAKSRVIKYNIQLAYATKLLQSGTVNKARDAIAVLAELAYDYPYRRQDIVDRLCNYTRMMFPQDKNVTKEWQEILKFAIQSIASIPRTDVNGQPLNIDLRQIRIQSMDFTGISLKDVTMWGCIVLGVTMPRANLENADIAGTVFVHCSLEWCNWKNAKMNSSFMDRRPTTIVNSRVWGSNLNEANIDKNGCILNNYDKSNFDSLIRFTQDGRIQLFDPKSATELSNRYLRDTGYISDGDELRAVGSQRDQTIGALCGSQPASSQSAPECRPEP